MFAAQAAHQLPLGHPVARARRSGERQNVVDGTFFFVERRDPWPGEHGNLSLGETGANGAQRRERHHSVANPVRGANEDLHACFSEGGLPVANAATPASGAGSPCLGLRKAPSRPKWMPRRPGSPPAALQEILSAWSRSRRNGIEKLPQGHAAQLVAGDGGLVAEAAPFLAARDGAPPGQPVEERENGRIRKEGGSARPPSARPPHSPPRSPTGAFRHIISSGETIRN